MKKHFQLKIILFLLAIFICKTAFATTWTQVIPNLYVDAESAVFNDNKVTFWVKNISKKPYSYQNHKPVAFLLTHQVASCNEGLMATIGIYKYSTDGKRISAYHDEVRAEHEFKPVVPDTINSAVFNFMCKKYKANQDPIQNPDSMFLPSSNNEEESSD